MPTQQDATAEFYTALQDPSRWVIKQGVPIFKSHQRIDPNTGKTIVVDLPKLYRIAANMQRLERVGGVPVRMTLGHTEPGKAEVEQPPVAGYYRNARVQPFGPNGEPAVVVDEWLDPQYGRHRKNFPYRSAEYYDETEQITGVALLTRDPYLDLGVVAYTKSDAKAVHYARTGQPTCYQFLMAGDPEMYPPTTPNGQPGTPVVPPVPPPSAHPVMPPVHATANVPYTAYGNPGEAGNWGGQNHTSTAPMGHSHPNTGWGYAGGPGQPPPQIGNMTTMPPKPPADDDDGLKAMYTHLTQASQHLARHISARNARRYDGAGGMPPGAPPGVPPDAPFPQGSTPMQPGLPGMPPPATPTPMMHGQQQPPRGQGTADSPYARHQYANPGAPTHGEPMRTISGQPVGYQMELDQVRYQLSEANRAIQVLLYERDQADTEACAAEIGRLASMGYQVGEYEVRELKSKPRDQRGAYINHIVSRYQRIGTDALPPNFLGDPTPGADPNANRPATQSEMEKALKLTEQNPQLDYGTALQYARSGAPIMGGAGAASLGAHAWPTGGAAPGGFIDPYAHEPSLNGSH